MRVEFIVKGVFRILPNVYDEVFLRAVHYFRKNAPL